MKREASKATRTSGGADRGLVVAAEGLADCRTANADASGEVDLVARKGAMLAFVEVKARATTAELDLAIDERRLRRVAAAAEILWHDLAKAGDDMRIDVILLAPGRAPRHLANVWHGG